MDPNYFIKKNKSEILRLMPKIITENYDGLYLGAMHETIKKQSVENIAVGSSHATYLIKDTLFGRGGLINFSINSQDMYYDFKNVEMAVKNSKSKIKRCFIILGWYNLGHDLSRENNPISCKSLSFENTVFNDLHNGSADNLVDVWTTVREAFKDPEQAAAVIEEAKRESLRFWRGNITSYYNNIITRKPLVYDLGGKAWKELTDDERKAYGKRRAEKHNRLFENKQTINENTGILYNMLKFLSENDIVPIVVVPPYTKEYNDFILPEMKELLYNVLTRSPVRLGYLNMNGLDIWNAEDFTDMDHVSNIGADKASQIIVSDFLQ